MSEPEKSPQDSQRLERTGAVCSKSLRLGFKPSVLNLSFGPFKEPQKVNLSGTLEKTGKESSVNLSSRKSMLLATGMMGRWMGRDGNTEPPGNRFSRAHWQ